MPCRIKACSWDETSDWGTVLTSPERNYYELNSCGPVAEREIERIDIDPVVRSKRGRLLPEVKEDKRNSLLLALAQKGILYESSPDYISISIAANQKKRDS